MRIGRQQLDDDRVLHLRAGRGERALLDRLLRVAGGVELNAEIAQHARSGLHCLLGGIALEALGAAELLLIALLQLLTLTILGLRRGRR